MLNANDRRTLIDFLMQHADGDVLVQAANRVATNVQDVETLKKFIQRYRPSMPVPEADVDRGNARDAPVVKGSMADLFIAPNDPEDLGPVPRKLGANGQAIEKLMLRNPTLDYSVDGLKTALHIPAAKIKPMLALLIERGRVRRTGNTLYRIVAK
jgi:hypothetical protein